VALSNLDRELLRDCIAQSPSAWENFSDRFLGLVLHVVHHTAIMRNIHLTPELRDDLVADVFVSWIDKDFAVLRRFRGQSSLATYLAVVARRKVVRRLTQLRLPHMHQSIDAMKLDPPSRETNAFAGVDLQDLESFLGSLSPNEATAVRMFHLEGKSYREIGTALGLPENSVGPFLSRAREKMKKLV
jgi:RNA polymerase sigma-70 factor, ECF subfamily